MMTIEATVELLGLMVMESLEATMEPLGATMMISMKEVIKPLDGMTERIMALLE